MKRLKNYIFVRVFKKLHYIGESPCIHCLFSVKMQILQDSSRASLPSGRRFTRRPPYNTSMTLICQIEAAGYSLSDQLEVENI